MTEQVAVTSTLIVDGITPPGDVAAAAGSSVKLLDVTSRPVASVMAAVIGEALDETLRDGVPGVLVLLETRVTPWLTAWHEVLERRADETGRVEVAQYWVHATEPGVRTTAGELSTLQSIAGLGPFAVQLRYATDNTTASEPVLTSDASNLLVVDALVHRAVDRGPTRFLLAFASTTAPIERLLKPKQAGATRTAASLWRLLGEGFGGSWHGGIAALLTEGLTEQAAIITCLGNAAKVTNVLRRRSVNPSFHALLDAAKRELAALNPTADRLPLEAKAAFLDARTHHRDAKEEATLKVTAGESDSVATPPGVGSGNRTNAWLEEQLARVTAERDAAQWIATEANSRAARFEAAHAELLEEHRQVCKHHSRVEERLHSEIATQVSRIRALEAELVTVNATVAALRRTARATSPVIRPHHSETPPPTQAHRVTTSEKGATPTEPSRSATPRGVPPLSHVPAPRPKTSTTTSKQSSPRHTPRIGTPLTRSPTRTEPESHTSDATRASSASSRRRAESPREARILLATAHFVKPTSSAAARSRSTEQPVPAAVSRMHSAVAQEQKQAAVAVNVVRPRLVTPVRSEQPFHSDNFQSTYRPTRLVRHSEWESAEDAVARDSEMRAVTTHRTRPVLGAPPTTQRSQYAASSARS